MKCHDVLGEKVTRMKHINIFFPLFLNVLAHEIAVVKLLKPSLRLLGFILVVRWKTNQTFNLKFMFLQLSFIEVKHRWCGVLTSDAFSVSGRPVPISDVTLYGYIYK